MKQNKVKTEYLILGLLLLLGLILRLYNYSSFSLSNDELSAIYRCNYNSFHELITQGVAIDFHPAGVQIFMYYWIKIFGNSIAAVRLPFIIAGVLAILFTYLFSRRWFSSISALGAATAIALMPFSVIFSQIARPYSSGLMLSMLLAWLWSIVLFPTKKEKSKIWIYAVLLGFAFALNLYNHYFSGLLAFIIGVSGAFFLNKEDYKNYLSALIIGTLLFIPHIPMTLHHLDKGGLSSWLAAPAWDWPLEHIKIIFTDWLRLGILISIIIFFYFYTKKQKGLFRIRLFTFLFFLLPMLIGLFYSIFINPILQHSILIFSMPFLLIWLFSFLSDELPKKMQYATLLFIAILFFNGAPSITGHPMIDIQNFEGIAHTVKQWKTKSNSSETLRLMESNSPDYIKYYLKDDTLDIKFTQWKFRDNEDLSRLYSILDSSQATNLEYVVLATNNNIAYNMMINHFPYLIYKQEYSANAKAYLFSKNKLDDAQYLLELPSSCLASFKKDSEQIAGLKEFSPGLEYQFKQTHAKGLSIKTKLLLDCKSLNSKAHLVFTIEREDQSENYWHSAPLHFFLNQITNQEIYFEQDLPLVNKGDILKVYLWNPELEDIGIKGFEICLEREI